MACCCDPLWPGYMSHLVCYYHGVCMAMSSDGISLA